jgi:phosphate transport system permease protein
MTIVAFASIAAAIVFLVSGSVPVLRREGLAFFDTSRWYFRQHEFGALSMVYGSAVVSLIALVLAVPVAIGAAIFTSEVCSRRVRMVVKVLVELLAGIPSVVYGLLGVLFLRDWIADAFDKLHIDALSGDTLLTGGVLLAVMVMPTITTLADDALQSVRRSARDAARGLGLTRAEAIFAVVMREARPGIIGAVLLGFGRAAGETIAVFLVVGRADNRLPGSLFSTSAIVDAGQTITSKLGGAETNIAAGDPLHSSAMLALGLVLLVAVLAVTFSADVLRGKITEA